MATILCNWDTLLRHHYTYGGVDDHLPGITKAYKLTCCIRISHALNAAGETIPYIKGDTTRILSGGGNGQYILEVFKLRNYLKGRYPNPEQLTGGVDAIKAKLQGKRGIITFGDLHADIWNINNVHTAAAEGYNIPALLAQGASGKAGVFLWDVLSFDEYLKANYG